MAHKITLYALSTCTFCQALKKMFIDLKIDHNYIEADLLEGEERETMLKNLKKVNPKCGFPTTVIDDKVITGYQAQKIKETLGIHTEIDDLYDKLRKINEKKGFYFNNNREQTFHLLRALKFNKDRYGYMACPCRLASSDRQKDKDIICPCIYRDPDVAEFGSCYCGLYVSRAWNDNEIEHVEIPERRPIERM